MTRRKKEAQDMTIEEERYGTLEVAEKIGKAFSGLTIGAGILLLLFSIYLIVTGPLTNSAETKLFFIVMLAFLGIVNTVGGLLLMGRD